MKTRGRTLIIVGILLILLLALVAQPALAQGRVHIVQRGETLYSIARYYGTTPQAIASANGLANARSALRIPIPLTEINL